MSLLPLLALVSCETPDSSSGAPAAACGDPDGSGGDTGDLPSFTGTWNTALANEYWDDNCTAADFDQNSEQYWTTSMEVSGSAPDGLKSEMGGNPDELFLGKVDRYGGFTMSGRHDHGAGDLYAQFGGLTYRDESLGFDAIRGSAFFGLDVEPPDGSIDCYARASWHAYKSD